MCTKCTAFGKWYTPHPVHVPYTKPPFGVLTPEGVPPPPGSEGVRAPSRIFTEGLSFHSGASGRGMYAFLIWCTVHVPYTKRRSSGRAVYLCSAGLPLPPNVHTHTYTQTYTHILSLSLVPPFPAASTVFLSRRHVSTTSITATTTALTRDYASSSSSSGRTGTLA
jgi:hypothetical protein